MKSIRLLRVTVFAMGLSLGLVLSGFVFLFSFTSEPIHVITAIAAGTQLLAFVMMLDSLQKAFSGIRPEDEREHPAFAEGPDKAPLFFLKLGWVVLLFGAAVGGAIAIGNGYEVWGAIILGSYGAIRLVPNYISRRLIGKDAFPDTSAGGRRPGWAAFRILFLANLIAASLLYATYMRVTRHTWDYMIGAGVLTVCLIPVAFLVSRSIGREFGPPEK